MRLDWMSNVSSSLGILKTTKTVLVNTHVVSSWDYSRVPMAILARTKATRDVGKHCIQLVDEYWKYCIMCYIQITATRHRLSLLIATIFISI